MLVKRIFIFTIVLFSVDMFRLIFIPKNALYALSFGAISLMVGVVFLIWIYDRTEKIKANFSFEIGIILLAVGLSMIGASNFHGQSFALTAWIQRGMYFYFFYFLLHAIRFSTKDLEKMVFIFSIIYVVFFLIQFTIYPYLLFDIRAEAERGTIRIFLPGSALVVLGYFMALHYFFTTNKVKFVFIALMIFLTIVLQGTRQNMGLVALGTVVFFLLSRQVKSKVMIGFLMIIGVVSSFMIFGEFFINLMELTEDQVGNEDEDIRLRAGRFFLTEFFPSPLAYFIGNGEAHGASSYGIKVASYKVVYHYYQSDVGIIGDFSKYGIIFLIGVLSIYYKVFSKRGLTRFPYVKYYFLISAIKIMLGSDFGSAQSIVVITIIFYLIDVEVHDRKARWQELKETLSLKKIGSEP